MSVCRGGRPGRSGKEKKKPRALFGTKACYIWPANNTESGKGRIRHDDHHQGYVASSGMTLFLAIDGAQPKNGDFMRRPRVPTHAQVAQTQSTPLKEKTVRPRNACPAIFLPVQQHPVPGKTCSEHSPSTAPPVYPGTPGCLALLTLPLILSP